MKYSKTPSGKNSLLRRDAEERRKKLKEKSEGDLFANNTNPLIHELQIHQIELEIQNEELRRAQIELEESRRKYSDLYDFAPVGYFTFDKNGLILEVNLTGAALLALGKNALMKKPFSRFIYREDQDLFYLHCRKVFESKGHQSCEIRLKSESSSQVYIRMRSIPVQDREGTYNQIRTVTSIIRDITERKKAEQAILKANNNLEKLVNEHTLELTELNKKLKSEIKERKKREQMFTSLNIKLQHLFSVTPGIIYTCQLKEPYQATYVNENIRVQFGYEPSEFLAPNFLINHIHPDDADRVLSELPAVIEQRCHKFEYRLLHKNGGYRWIYSTMSLGLDPIGNPQEIVGVCIDITERKKIEKESEAIIQTAIDGFATVNMQGRFLDINNSLCRMFGYSRNELLHMGIQDIEAKETLDEIAQHIRIAKEEGCSRFETLHRQKDGRIINVDISVQYMDIDGGKFVSFIRDITERKSAEEVMKKSQERYRRITETITDYIYTVRVEAGLPVETRHSEACFVMTGYTSDEFINDPYLWIRMVVEEDKNIVRQQIKQVLSGLFPAPIEHRIMRKDGTVRWVENSVVPYHDANGTLISYDGVIRDITERTIIGQALMENKDRYRRLVELSPEAIAVHSAGKFTYVNPAGAKLLGADSPEELIGIQILDVIPPDYREFVKSQIHQTEVEKIQTPLKEQKMLRLDGQIIDVEITGIPTTYAEKPATQIVIRDMTERKKLEAQLLHSQKMESIGTLAGGIAHDFNNILTAIIGFADIVSKMMKEDDPLKLYVDHIQSAAEDAATLISDLLAFSRKLEVNLAPSNINDIIVRLEKFLVRIIGEDIEFRTILTDGLPNIMLDSGQIEQVLMNLAANARDAMSNGGKLTITTERYTLNNEFVRNHGLGKPGDYALISFADTGTGIDEKIRDKIFEPFFTTKEVDKGTGLGLSIVYGIVKQHNGYIDVYSEPGKGTTFRIYLPLTEQTEETEIKKPQVPVTITGNETILIAEDSNLTRELLITVLAKSGYNVISAKNGKEAVNEFIKNKDKVQLVLLDIVMPKKNGKEAYDEIRKIRPDIKALFFSGYSEDVINQKDIIGKGFKIIAKPLKPDVLLNEIREELDRV